MNSYDVQLHGRSDHRGVQAKLPWVTPLLQVIAVESAENGTHPQQADGNGGHFARPRS